MNNSLSIRLFNGDCFDYFPQIADKSIDLVCVDPPYGTTGISWDSILDFDKMWIEIDRVTKDKANIVIFGSQPFTSKLILSKLKWFRYELIWNKNKCGSPGLAKYRPMKVHENILIFRKSSSTGTYNPIKEKGKPYKRHNPNGYGTGTNTHGYGWGKVKTTGFENFGTRNPKSILHASRNFSAQQTTHPTQKPTNLLAWLIMTFSNEKDTVLDFTMGTGSCGVASVSTNRNFIGVEMDEKYFEIAKEKIENTEADTIKPSDHQLTTQIHAEMQTTNIKKRKNNED